jgi:acetolactate synthase I/II/III large subunit
MKVSDYIADFLYAQDVKCVFELVGGMITHLVDSLNRQGKIQIVSVHHEQAAAFAAESMARITGVPGVAIATSGPGATNLLTGIGSCYFDSIPAVFITGQVNLKEQKGNRPIRQLGFQETDIVSMAVPITKAFWRVQSPEDIPLILDQAFTSALSGRPGPILIDIPMDIQRSEIVAKIPTQVSGADTEELDSQAINEMVTDLKASQNPLVLAGGGLRSARVANLFRKFVDQVKVPVVNSLMAVDVLPYTHPLRVGLIGSYGNRWANLAIGRADFLLVLGSRLDIRQTGSDIDAFKGNCKIYHVDCEAGEINNRLKGCKAILAHLRPFLSEVLKSSAGTTFPGRIEWMDEIAKLRSLWSDIKELDGTPGINPNKFFHQLSQASGQAAAFTIDVGQHQMWAAQSLDLSDTQRFLTTGGMGAMGFALPAAIGAAMANHNEPVVMIAGDGGFQINIQELQTIVHHHLPIKMIILNNRCCGMVRQFQQSYFDERYQSTLWGYSAPDFVQVAGAYGIAGQTVKSPDEVHSALKTMWLDPKAPFILQVMIDTFSNVYPKIAFGHPITEMDPFAEPIEMEGT